MGGKCCNLLRMTDPVIVEPTMTGPERKAALMLAQVTQATIAKRTKMSRATVSRVIDGAIRNAKVQRAVAKAIGRPVAEVFPEQGLRPQAA